MSMFSPFCCLEMNGKRYSPIQAVVHLDPCAVGWMSASHAFDLELASFVSPDCAETLSQMGHKHQNLSCVGLGSALFLEIKCSSSVTILSIWERSDDLKNWIALLMAHVLYALLWFRNPLHCQCMR